MEGDPKTVSLSIELAVLIIMCFVALIGLIYRNLDKKVDNVEAKNNAGMERISKDISTKLDKMCVSMEHMQSNSVDKGRCLLTQQMHEERNRSMNKRIDDVRAVNREEHKEIFSALSNIHELMAGIRDSITLLSVAMDKNNGKEKGGQS